MKQETVGILIPTYSTEPASISKTPIDAFANENWIPILDNGRAKNLKPLLPAVTEFFS